MKYVERVLPIEICPRVESKLAAGNSLSKELLNRVHDRTFRVRSLLPSTLTDKVALDLDHGGLFDRGERMILPETGDAIEEINDEVATRWLVDEIMQFFKKQAESILLFEDAMARRGDPSLSDQYSEILYRGDEVYAVIRAKGATENHIRTTIDETYSIPVFVGILSCPRRAVRCDVQELDQDDIRDIALGTEVMILGAYDGEGFLFCDELPVA